jgi:hypothetical protein
MKTWSTSLVVNKMKTKTTSGTTSHPLGWKNQKSSRIKASEDTEWLESLYLADANVKWYGDFEKTIWHFHKF